MLIHSGVYATSGDFASTSWSQISLNGVMSNHPNTTSANSGIQVVGYGAALISARIQVDSGDVEVAVRRDGSEIAAAPGQTSGSSDINFGFYLRPGEELTLWARASGFISTGEGESVTYLEYWPVEPQRILTNAIAMTRAVI